MVLSDRSIMKAVEEGEIGFSPEIDWKSQLKPASIDLRLGSGYKTQSEEHNSYILDLDCPEMFVETGFSTSKKYVYIHSKDLVLATTLESVKIGKQLVGELSGRSSIGRLGLFVHITAGLCDPGFEGKITLELYNSSNCSFYLPVGMRICQIKFSRLDTPCDLDYGELVGSKYQNQEGPTESRIYQEL